MLERYKALGAMLALGEFSVSEIAALSGVGESTVRTILRRSNDYVEQVGSERSGRRGGQPRRWRVRADGRERLRGQLLELERLGVGPWIGESEPGGGSLPASIIAAEGALLRLAPATTDREERAEFVKLARAHAAAADAVCHEGTDAGYRRPGGMSDHRHLVQVLMELEEAEQQIRWPLGLRTTAAWQALVSDLLLTTGRIDDQRLTSEVKKRLYGSFTLPGGLLPGRAAPAQGDVAVLGFELLPRLLTATVVNGYGELLASKQCELGDMEPETVVSATARLVTDLATHIPAAAGHRRVALAFQLGAPVDNKTGMVLFYHKAPPEPPGRVREVNWPDRQPFGYLLEQATHMPVLVENDANAFAMYELWFGIGREESRFAVVLVREGVGGSLVIDHRLFSGPMELGNLSVLPEKGRACDCGSIGCLETTGGTHGILENVAKNLASKKLEIPAVDSVESAAVLAESADPDIAEAAEKAFEDAGYANAKGIGILVNFARPKRVVVYAPSVMAEPSHTSAVKFITEVHKFQNYCHTVYNDTELIIKPLQPFDGAHGAALLGLEYHFGITADVALAGLEPSR